MRGSKTEGQGAHSAAATGTRARKAVHAGGVQSCRQLRRQAGGACRQAVAYDAKAPLAGVGQVLVKPAAAEAGGREGSAALWCQACTEQAGPAGAPLPSRMQANREGGGGEGGTAGWLAGGLGSLTCGSALCKTQGLQGGGKQFGRVSERENDRAQRPQRRQPAWEAPHQQRPAAVGVLEPCKGQQPPATALPFGSFIHPWGGCTWNRGRSGSSSCCYREG